jgi:hypothetical protein
MAPAEVSNDDNDNAEFPAALLPAKRTHSGTVKTQTNDGKLIAAFWDRAALLWKRKNKEFGTADLKSEAWTRCVLLSFARYLPLTGLMQIHQRLCGAGKKVIPERRPHPYRREWSRCCASNGPLRESPFRAVQSQHAERGWWFPAGPDASHVQRSTAPSDIREPRMYVSFSQFKSPLP